MDHGLEGHHQIEYALYSTYPEDEKYAEAEANAYLIAAAPDLLAALDEVVDSGLIDYCHGEELISQVKDALAKARGARP